jgi:transcriptional regulator with XRE-family HTH domain
MFYISIPLQIQIVSMSVLSENLRYLRAVMGVSQKKLAGELIITRGRLAKYEEGKSEPPFDIMLRISNYFHISIDILLLIDIKKIGFSTRLIIEENKILFPFLIEQKGCNYIELLPTFQTFDL